MNFRKLYIRIFNWEYWNSTIFYLPVMPYLFYKMVRAKNLFVFNAVNPGIEYGGFTMESKWKIQQGSAAKYFPKTLLVRKGELNLASIEDFEFPIYVKPDIGGKGRGVEILKTKNELIDYSLNCPIDFLIQEKVNYPMEAGIFYVRFPHESCGSITGIVGKEFMHLTGDGISTVEELIDKNDRYFLQKKELENLLSPDILKSIPSRDEKINLPEIGNHARGSRFYNESHRIHSSLNALINRIANDFPGFYFGRFDIRFNSWEELAKGENFKIIELNGSGSEPTHIYDQQHSIFYAWKEIIRHWNYLFEIGKINNQSGVNYLNIREGIKLLLHHRKTMQLLEQIEIKR